MTISSFVKDYSSQPQSSAIAELFWLLLQARELARTRALLAADNGPPRH